LRDFEQRSANPVAIADADFTIGQALHSEVLSELPKCEIVSLKFSLPVVIGIDLVDKHGAVFTAVAVEITLRVAVDVEPSNQAPSLHGLLPNGGVDSLTAPCDVAGITYVD
jgi:hypothetical protein